MTEEELKKAFYYLANKYVRNSEKLKSIIDDIERHGGDGAKGILHDLTKEINNVEPSDSELIKEIVFYFC